MTEEEWLLKAEQLAAWLEPEDARGDPVRWTSSAYRKASSNEWADPRTNHSILGHMMTNEALSSNCLMNSLVVCCRDGPSLRVLFREFLELSGFWTMTEAELDSVTTWKWVALHLFLALSTFPFSYYRETPSVILTVLDFVRAFP